MDLGKKQLLFSYIGILIAFVWAVDTSLFLEKIISTKLFIIIILIGFLILTLSFLSAWGKSIKFLILGIFKILGALAILSFIMVEFAYLESEIEGNFFQIQAEIVIVSIALVILYEFYIKKLFNIGVIKYIFTHNSLIVSDWTSIKTNQGQNTDFREINLEGRLLRNLEFDIKPLTQYWRAGFKISKPNGYILPLRSDGASLIHLGSNKNYDEVGMTSYINGEHLVSKSNLNVEKNKPMHIKFQINDKNFTFLYINNKLELEHKFESDYFKKLYLAAWTDGNEGSVEFSNIKYTLR